MLKKRFLCWSITVCLLLGTLCAAAPGAAAQTVGYTLPEGTTLYAQAAILVSCGSDTAHDVVLFEKDADGVHAPGAMMRYMVLTYTLHRVREAGLDIDAATGTYTRDMFDSFVAGSGVPTANMAYGEVWTLRDLMAASFVQNASDAVTVLAVAVDGSVSAFVQGMNDLAQTLGCDYTHFANVTGLDSLSQYTTARDMVRIIRYAQQFSEFESLAGNRQCTVHPVSGGKERTLVSSNSLYATTSQFYYSPLVVSRTGLSDREGRTCASLARDSGYEYLAVVLGCPETNSAGESGLHYRDTRTLFRWAFNQFSYLTVLAKSEILAGVKVRLAWSTDRLNLVPASEFSTVTESRLDLTQVIKQVTLYQDTVDAPVEKGDVLGKVELIINVDQKLGEVELVAAESIRRSWLLVVLSGVSDFFTSPWFWLGVALLLLLGAGYAVLNVMYNRQRRRRRLGRTEQK